MKVKVVLPENKFGWINNRRVYDGEVIEIYEKQFSKNWMTRLDQNKNKGQAPRGPN
jgi:hypothetical protein